MMNVPDLSYVLLLQLREAMLQLGEHILSHIQLVLFLVDDLLGSLGNEARVAQLALCAGDLALHSIYLLVYPLYFLIYVDKLIQGYEGLAHGAYGVYRSLGYAFLILLNYHVLRACQLHKICSCHLEGRGVLGRSDHVHGGAPCGRHVHLCTEVPYGADNVHHALHLLCLLSKLEVIGVLGPACAHDGLLRVWQALIQLLRNKRHEGVKQRYIFESQAMGEEAFYLDHILEEEVYTQLIRAIDALPGQCRKVFRLVLENKSNQEIAEILSLSVETVKSYKKQGKALLYKRLKDVIPLALLTSILQF